MLNSWKAVRILLLSAVAVALANADIIVFANGDKLAGHFVRSTSTTVTFKSDALGDLTIDWSKVKELETSAKVAVIRKGVKLRKKEIPSDLPQGTLAMQDQKLQVTPAPGAPAQSIPVADSAVVLEQVAFQKAITRTPGFLSDWTGTVTAGATLVQATQTNRTFTGAVNLVRTEPSENWLDPSYRTSFAFSESYGVLTQPGTPSIKTSIFHAAGEQDKYFTPVLFGFGQADFDHNYSQGLDLQQTYNGGIGWTVLNTSAQELDLKGAISYIRQQFAAGSNQSQPTSMNLIGATFAEHYHRKLPRGVGLDESLSATPAFNNTHAYSAAFTTLLTMPVYKHLSGSTGVIDTFLNDPPLGFKKNSFQFTLGLTYSLQ
jgi:Protein of unknown function, DUF481